MRKAERSARTRAALIEAAIELFGERGYRASSLKAIAERAKITHGVIPFHFGSKEGLLIAVIEVCFGRFSDAVLAPLRDRSRDHGLGDLKLLLESQVEFSEVHPEISKVLTVLMAEAIGSSPELRPHYVAFHERVRSLGCEWVREGQRRGTLRPQLDVEGAVEAVLAFLTGARTHHLLAGTDRRQIHQQMLAILESGVLAGAVADTREETPR